MRLLTGVDLSKIPHCGAGPFKTYKQWLRWKLSNNMICGEMLQLPIFSSFEIRRWHNGFTLRARHKDTIIAFCGDGILAAVESLLDAIDTGVLVGNETVHGERLIKMHKTAELRDMGYTWPEIAREIGTTENYIDRYRLAA